LVLRHFSQLGTDLDETTEEGLDAVHRCAQHLCAKADKGSVARMLFGFNDSIDGITSLVDEL
jgi:hypothetical protein